MITRSAIALAALAILQASPRPPAPSVFNAFRFDATHVVAVLKVVDDPTVPRAGTEVSASPVARLGFAYRDLPSAMLAHVLPEVRVGDRWTVHLGPHETASAVVQRLVLGEAGCSHGIGALLDVGLTSSGRPFSSHPARYVVAVPGQASTGLSGVSRVGRLTGKALTRDHRQRIEELLSDLLIRELPRVRAEAEPDLARAAESELPDRQHWARERRELDEDLAAGRGKLSFDVQPLRLTPDGRPLYFVRGTWHVGGRQAFAASVWLTGPQPFTILRQNLRPAEWLRMFEFQGRVSNDQLGMILNVFDVDGDGWGEILFAQGGYESMSVELREYSPDWFNTLATYSFGC